MLHKLAQQACGGTLSAPLLSESTASSHDCLWLLPCRRGDRAQITASGQAHTSSTSAKAPAAAHQLI